MIVESWPNERTPRTSRGRVIGIYTSVNLAATTAGQMVLTLGDPNGYFFFVLAATVYCLALLPFAMSATSTPKPLTSVSLDLRGLWRNSPIAVFAIFMVGISTAAFGTLVAVYAARIGLELRDIALFASIPILAGDVSQIPVGIASDKYDCPDRDRGCRTDCRYVVFVRGFHDPMDQYGRCGHIRRKRLCDVPCRRMMTRTASTVWELSFQNQAIL